MNSELVVWEVDDYENPVVTMFLERKLGVSTESFNSGEAVMEALEERVPDLLVLDWTLSDGRRADGIDVLRYMENRNINIPVIVRSGHDFSDYVIILNNPPTS